MLFPFHSRHGDHHHRIGYHDRQAKPDEFSDLHDRCSWGRSALMNLPVCCFL
jgi:hypothetical protein